jgi:hypothetical protein
VESSLCKETHLPRNPNSNKRLTSHCTNSSSGLSIWCCTHTFTPVFINRLYLYTLHYIMKSLTVWLDIWACVAKLVWACFTEYDQFLRICRSRQILNCIGACVPVRLDAANQTQVELWSIHVESLALHMRATKHTISCLLCLENHFNISPIHALELVLGTIEFHVNLMHMSTLGSNYSMSDVRFVVVRCCLFWWLESNTSSFYQFFINSL